MSCPLSVEQREESTKYAKDICPISKEIRDDIIQRHGKEIGRQLKVWFSSSRKSIPCDCDCGCEPASGCECGQSCKCDQSCGCDKCECGNNCQCGGCKCKKECDNDHCKCETCDCSERITSCKVEEDSILEEVD